MNNQKGSAFASTNADPSEKLTGCVAYYFGLLPVVTDGATWILPLGSGVVLWPWPPELTTWLEAAFLEPLLLPAEGVRLAPAAGL